MRKEKRAAELNIANIELTFKTMKENEQS
jgi:hypothetical protein